MEPATFNLFLPDHAYLYGFLLGDGHLSKRKKGSKKGSLSVELSVRDRPLLEKFQKMVSCYSSIHDRTRDTNFLDNTTSSVWTLCDLATRDDLVALGLPEGRKSEVVGPPAGASWRDFWRGVIDADGSLGLTATGRPFVSLVTSSDDMATAFAGFIEPFAGFRKRLSRNRRDNVYNIMVTMEVAQAVVREMYYPDCLSLDRKQETAQHILAWTRPTTVKARGFGRRWWTPKEDILVRTLSLDEATKATGRSKASVSMRSWRLSH